MNRPVARPVSRPYVRPMKGWWNRDPFFVAYMARELTAFAVLAYSFVMAVGLVRLSQGESAWNGWLSAVRSPLGILLHIIFLISMVVHAKSWFDIMPKTMPAMFVKGKRVAAASITRTGYIAAAAGAILVLAIAKGALL